MKGSRENYCGVHKWRRSLANEMLVICIQHRSAFARRGFTKTASNLVLYPILHEDACVLSLKVMAVNKIWTVSSVYFFLVY